ncbi:hypothetical protein GCM10010269_52670 [Streptomyces humidus]|uniref:Uncharacterized protein n=1 Tax=Streptomyces humidus TaxID=52259 RepID=A0A918FZ64_9ACTN|nr:hypothetical protein GCM10010269_52670 [Streptomyces humidus]
MPPRTCPACLDERLKGAAGRPVLVPGTIAVDRAGQVRLSWPATCAPDAGPRPGVWSAACDSPADHTAVPARVVFRATVVQSAGQATTRPPSA